MSDTRKSRMIGGFRRWKVFVMFVLFLSTEVCGRKRGICVEVGGHVS